jgi:hypothetical protein
LIIISLLVTTWLHYRRRLLDPGGLRLSVEGLDNGMEPERISHLPDDPLSYREHDPNDQAERNPDNYAAERIPDDQIHLDPAVNDHADNDQWGKESVTEWKGKDNIYQGILWMKDKYEQYREQADQRYELLKEELKRSEHRYQDLLLSMEESKGMPPATGQQQELMAVVQNAGEGGVDARQLIIDELEEQLRIERLKVEELVARLQSNGQLLLNIHQELDKSVQIAKEAE